MTLRRLQELTKPEALRLLVWSLWTMLEADLLLRATSLPVLLKRFGQGPSSAGADQTTTLCAGDGPLERLWRYSTFITGALLRSRRPCLLRCLVLYRHCRGRGMPASIHFGIKRGTEGLDGHSWVSLHGTPLFEEEELLHAYVNVFTYPETPPENDPHWGLATAKGLS